MASPKIDVKNRKAGFEYHLLDTYECGVILMGSEIKSIRAGGASISEAFCAFLGNELVIRNMQINQYGTNIHFVHEPKRDRKLLLHAAELAKLKKKLKDVGMTIIPTRLFIAPNGIAKIEIALAKGKKMFDKRESLKAKDLQRDMERD
ncbi:MAG: SsrA-binding protein SmpB [Flavobacteriales bacterium]|nr:SsrA-binding protein SmpB [Flavobacteriales bacterium]MBK6945248.1 SsrA-binding protein SmpB [Flavobacteriales bacterium]MBK7239598.1 SsrA-binding protein SmpB [Flavobacteriales bacterium]MBK7296146.1 SsrA-binding protein SmpB [Flavobacteriales bacterium]MBK9535196.1 SsrA-binding protein SmpB [Flavobacteriales bacterium]